MSPGRKLRQLNNIRRVLTGKEARFIEICASLAGKKYDASVLCAISLHRIAIIHAREFYHVPGTADMHERRKS